MATTPASSSASSQQQQAADSINAAANHHDDSHPQDASQPMSVDLDPATTTQQSDTKQPQHQNQSPDSHKPQINTNNSNNNNKANIVVEQKRPMNAFLLFCKQQRSLVREKHPNLENREITRILGDWWSKLDKEQKSKYTDLARQHKQAFMEANPDFKWCKTTITPPTTNAPSNNNNNNNSSFNTNNNDESGFITNNNINNHHRQISTINKEQSPYLPSLGDSHLQLNVHQIDNSCGTRDILRAATNISSSSSSSSSIGNSRQHEAPKPPKKRYLERNETAYSRNNNSSSNNNSNNSKNNDDPSKDNIVPYLSLDQAMLDRVIERALSEKSNDSPTAGLNMCKDSSSNNWSSSITTPMETISTASLSTTTATTTTTAAPISSSSSHSNGDEEPVDFSMKVTFRTTNQSIIDNVIEKAYSGSVDVAGGASRSSDAVGTVHGRFGPAIRKINTEVT